MAKANKELQKLKANHQKLIDLKEDYKATQVNIQIKASQAWISYAEGDMEKAVALMTDAADMEDGTSKHPVTPGEVLPARELLGDLHFKLDQYDKALAAYEMSLESHQKRFNSLFGAGLAAEKTGNLSESERYFSQLASITANANGNRPELEYALEFLADYNSRHYSYK